MPKSRKHSQLGIVVLPVPRDAITISEYKEKYGIDLHEFFYVNNDGYTVFRPDVKKIFYLDLSGSEVNVDFSCQAITPITAIDTTEEHYLKLGSILAVNDNPEVSSVGGLTISILDDYASRFEF